MPGTSASGGRNKKTLAEHAITGTGRKTRGTLTTSPPDLVEPPKGHPRTPHNLTGEALAEWTRMVTRLDAAKTLSTVDDAVLYQYSCLFAETEGIKSARRTNARLIKKLETALGRVRGDDQIAAVASAIVQVQKLDAKHGQQLRQGRMAIRQYLVEFGMTPAARSRVKPTADAKKSANPLDEYTGRVQ